MERSLSDVKIAELRCIQVTKGGLKYELMLSVQSANISNSGNSMHPKATASTSEIGKRKHFVESKFSEPNVEATKHQNLSAGDMKEMRPKSTGCINSGKKNSGNIDQKSTLQAAGELKKRIEGVMAGLQTIEKELKVQELLINEMQRIAVNLEEAFKNMDVTKTNLHTKKEPLLDN